MYGEYFGLDREPFSISPDPAFLYPSEQHTNALATLNHGMSKAGGFIMLTGEVGTGKTTVSRMFLHRLSSDVKVAYILNAKLDALDVLRSVCAELAISVEDAHSNVSLVAALNAYLLSNHEQGLRTLIVIEEAQNLGADVLEMLRLLTNLETDTAKLLHIMLVGQPELLDLIHRRDLRQLNQRVIARSHLMPLSRPELRDYVNHRLQTAGANRALFSRSAWKALYMQSQGYPRLINIVADRALLAAYGANLKHVTRKLINEAAREVHGQRAPNAALDSSSLWKISALVMVLLLGLIVGYWLVTNVNIKSFNLEGGPAKADVMPQEIGGPVVAPSPASQPAPAVAVEPIAVAPVQISEDVVRHSFTTALFGLWGKDISLEKNVDPCVQARSFGVACIPLGTGTAELLESNRPALIKINYLGEQQFALLESAMGEDIKLRLMNETVLVNSVQFDGIWEDSVLSFWMPPVGYTQELLVGEHNPILIDWLQGTLKALYPIFSERLITGGRYSDALADRIRLVQFEQNLEADGVLGRHTIMRLNELLNLAPVLKDRSSVAPSSSP